MADARTESESRVPAGLHQAGLPRVSRESVAALLHSSATPLAEAVARVRADALRSGDNYAAFGNAP
jgi:hypothetical protein